MKAKLIVLTIIISVVVAGTRVYDIEPYRNCNSKVHGRIGIGQTFVATCDSFVWVEVFIGAPNDTGYNVEIYEYPMGVEPIFTGYAPGKISYDYTRAMLRRNSTKPIIKGRTYFLKITNLRGDFINYYYDKNDPYKYGRIKIGGRDDEAPFQTELG